MEKLSSEAKRKNPHYQCSIKTYKGKTHLIRIKRETKEFLIWLAIKKKINISSYTRKLWRNTLDFEEFISVYEIVKDWIRKELKLAPVEHKNPVPAKQQTREFLVWLRVEKGANISEFTRLVWWRSSEFAEFKNAYNDDLKEWLQEEIEKKQK